MTLYQGYETNIIFYYYKTKTISRKMLHHLFTTSGPRVATTAKPQNGFISCAGYRMAINISEMAASETTNSLNWDDCQEPCSV